MISENNLATYKKLFRGREDIYAVRWEKDGKGGYMPAYKVDWNEYNKHKATGGNFSTFKNKKPEAFNDVALNEHLIGNKTIGVYPLLIDNTSCFVAADFDEANWLMESKALISECHKSSIPAYLERSRSGNGGHVWIFLKEAYPAFKSRKIVLELIRKALNFSDFDKEVSFDRLFPNQDYHSRQGFGNLIALPLQGNALKNNNSCFIHLDTLLPFADQWDFLNSIQFTDTNVLDNLYSEFAELSQDTSIALPFIKPNGGLQIIIRNQIFIHRSQLSPKIIAFIRDNLNFLNTDYLIKKKIGKSIYKTEKYFNLIEERENEIMLPRGFVAQLVNFCKTNNIPFEIIDERKKLKGVNFKSKIQLFDYQYDVLEITDKKDFGVIVAPPGSGKTVMGLEIIARKSQPTLIIVHRKQLLDQWVERIQNFLSIPKKDIGQITSGKYKKGKQITVAMIQSLKSEEIINEISNSFGNIIVDECHHIPAKTFRETISSFNPFYLYGLTATPKRKNNDEKLIYIFVGEILAQVNPDYKNEYPGNETTNIQVNIRETNLYAPFDYQIDKYETISKILIYDCSRNKIIVDDIINQVNNGKRGLVLTERKEHVNVLNLYLKDRFETITITGDDSESNRKLKLEQIKLGHFQVLISTGQFFGEGMDIDTLECLFLVYPFAFEGKLIQYIGRIQRSEQPPIIFDYRDSNIDYFEKLFKQRNRYYKKLAKKILQIEPTGQMELIRKEKV